MGIALGNKNVNVKSRELEIQVTSRSTIVRFQTVPFIHIKFCKSPFQFSCHTLWMASRLPGVSLIGYVIRIGMPDHFWFTKGNIF